jgi:maltooligosyltrehalose trehalohydrolase
MRTADAPTTRRIHRMPFGAECRDGSTLFRLWAPAASTVDVVLGVDDDARGVAMARRDDGWFERELDDARAGTRYRFRIDRGMLVPDPASRANPDGVHAASAVVDPAAYAWRDGAWVGRPWREAIVYELHVGTFTSQGTFDAAIARLDDLAELGVTAVELMPLAAFPGTRNWGYDGVLPFAPAAAYGTPHDLKRLIDAAHSRGLMMLLDVVYNHFGPEGNYLHVYARQFFNPAHRTPWGAAINFGGDASRTVREFFVHNALYWLEEFHFDGLRLDAIHAIVDDSRPDFVTELATSVRERTAGREIHLVLENDRNQARYLRRDDAGRPILATAQWNDDVHHALHIIATGERDGYYVDYASHPIESLGRALAEGFAYQGETSAFRGRARGEPSAQLPPTAFVAFAQNHDQTGNRALGERLSTLADAELLRALVACVLMSPQVPLLFMGEEFGASTPFLFFCDFGPDLAESVTRGRREEFARFSRFGDPQSIPDPNGQATFDASKLDWREASAPSGVQWRAFYRDCLARRQQHVLPLLRELTHGGSFDNDDGLLRVTWTTGSGTRLHLVANLSHEARSGVALPHGVPIFFTDAMPTPGTTATVPRCGVAFLVEHRS